MFIAACSSGGEDNASGNGGNSGEGSNEIVAWAWDPKFNIAALEIAEEYYDGEEEVELNIIENAQDDIIQKLNTGLSSGSMKGLPNLVLIEDYRAQSFLQAYPDAFYELTDYFNQDDFASYKLAPTSHDGKQYGLPFDTGATGLYLRTDYLEEAGATPNIADNEALREAFQVYKQIIEADIVEYTSDWSQFVGAFNGGEVASIFTGNWITPSVKAEAEQSGNWAVVPIPSLTVEGATNVSNLGGSSFYVLNIDGKEKAAKFLANTFGSNGEMYQDLVTDIGALGTYLPPIEEDAYQQEDEFFGGQKITAQFSEWMDQIPAVNYGMHTYAIDDILVVEMQNYLGGKALDEVLNDAQNQAETQLK